MAKGPKTIYLIIGAIVVLVITGFFLYSRINTGGGQITTNEILNRVAKTSTKDKVPEFNLKDYNGKTVSLADFSGKPLIINSWASWCPFCVKELSDFATVQNEFKNQIVIIAINRSESLKIAKRFSDELNITNDLINLLDPKDSFYQSIGGFSMPETLFIDKEGNIVEHKRGPMDADEIRQKIKSIL